jgi:hypothetical protein
MSIFQIQKRNSEGMTRNWNSEKIMKREVKALGKEYKDLKIYWSTSSSS